MFDWLQNPHADYVLAAYGVALIALIALGLTTWFGARKAANQLRELQKKS